MWPSWLKRRAPRSTPCPPTPLVVAAATPSLKDIQSLVHPEPPAHPPHSDASPPRIFHRLRVVVSTLMLLRTLQPAQVAAEEETQVATREEGGHLVLYFTSLSVIRRTFIDCQAVRYMLTALHAVVDERDLYMDKRFATDLAALLPHHAGVNVPLPQLFFGGRHLGGAKEVRRLHLSGELCRIIAVASTPAFCLRCGSKRYLLCGNCNGRHMQCNYNRAASSSSSVQSATRMG